MSERTKTCGMWSHATSSLPLFLQSLFLAWSLDVLEYPCCSLGLFQCSNLEENWRKTLKWISQKYLCCGKGIWIWPMNVPYFGLCY